MIRKTLLSLTSLLTACSLWAAPEVESFLPVDTNAVLKINTGILQDHQDNPVSKILSNDSLLECYSSFVQEADADLKKLSSLFADTSDIAEGDIVFTLRKINIVDEKPEAEGLIVVGYNGDEGSVLQCLEENGSKHVQAEGYRTYPMYSFTSDEEGGGVDLSFMFTEDYILISASVNVLHQTVDAILDGLDSSFEQSDAYAYLKDHWDSNDLYAYLDLKTLAGSVNSLIELSMAPKEGDMPNMMMPQAADIIDALKLEELEAYYLNCSFEDDEAVLDGIVTYNGAEGVGSLIECVRGDLEYPSFVPAGVSYATFYHYDIPMFFENIEGMLQKASPMAYAIYQQYLMGYNQQLGVDIRDAVVSGLGDDLGKVYLGPVDEEEWPMLSTLLYVRLNDPEKVQSALDSILNMVNSNEEINTIDYENTVIYDMTEYELPTHTQFAVVDQWLLFGQGDENLIKDIVDLKNNGGETLWENEYLLREMDANPNSSGYVFADYDVLMSPLLKLTCWFADLNETPIDEEAIMSAVSFPYYTTGYFSCEDGVLTSHYIIKNK